MAEKFANFCSTTLAANAANSDLTITVASSANVPSLGASDFFRVTLVRASDGAREIVKCTNVSGTTWTITRAQESTTALTLVTGDTVIHRLTAGACDAMSTRDTVSIGSPSGTATSKSVTITCSRAAYFNLRIRITDGATPTLTPTLSPPTGSSDVDFERVTNSSGVVTVTLTHVNASRDYYVQVVLNGEITVSSAITIGT